jgi:plasmid stability protein
MPANLSVKNVPDKVLARLRRRAARHHRSLQRELLAILEESAFSGDKLTLEEVLLKVRRLGLRTPAESTRMIRSDRNAR